MCNFEKWEQRLRKGLAGFDRRKVAKSKFLCSNDQSLEVLSKQISELSMISEIGKLCATKKFHYTSWGVCSKIMMFDRVQTLQKKSLSLNVWLTKFVQKVATKTGGHYPPRSL